ncbi:MAG: hypothetical protein HQ521_03740 [Bacteroidetes bacterium]|nr:hypothetical protein [Bacteroidota bacterium]
MKKLNYLLVLLTLVSFSYYGNSQTVVKKSDSKVSETNKVEVYYFHNTRRCATCNAVEDVTKAALEEYYPEQMKSGEITFQSLNLEEDTGETVARELGVSGQTLLIILNGKKKDLTNDAFMYAKTKPEKLKEKVNKVISSAFN